MLVELVVIHKLDTDELSPVLKKPDGAFIV